MSPEVFCFWHCFVSGGYSVYLSLVEPEKYQDARKLILFRIRFRARQLTFPSNGKRLSLELICSTVYSLCLLVLIELYFDKESLTSIHNILFIQYINNLL